jgi:hypothetical protein
MADLADELERAHLRRLRRDRQLLREIAEASRVDDARRRLERQLELMARCRRAETA